MIRALICDDEPAAREILNGLLTKYSPEVEIAGEAGSVAEGTEKILSLHPDLVFLDIEMPDGSGFDVLSRVAPYDFVVVFVTAYGQYALQAIKSAAADYLMKPVDRSELKLAVEKAARTLYERNAARKLNSMRRNLSSLQLGKIVVPNVNGFAILSIADIVRCEADRNYTILHVANGTKHTASRPLKDFEDMLTDHNFMRVHKSHVINMGRVVKFTRSGEGTALMDDGSEVDLSRGLKDEFIRRFTQMHAL